MLTFSESQKMLGWEGKVKLDRFTELRRRDRHSVQVESRKWTLFVMDSDNNYTIFMPHSTLFGEQLPTKLVKSVVKKLSRYTPADVAIVDGKFAIRMRPGRGLHIAMPDDKVAINCYGIVCEPHTGWEYGCFKPVVSEMRGLDSKCGVLYNIIHGEDDECLSKKTKKISQVLLEDYVYNNYMETEELPAEERTHWRFAPEVST